MLKKDPATTVTVTVGRDLSATESSIQTLVDAYNDLLAFKNQQVASAVGGNAGSIGRDALLRGLQNQLATELNAQRAVGGTYERLAEVGIGFTQTGELTFDQAVFDTAAQGGVADLEKLFGGGNGQDGAFQALSNTIERYTEAGGLIPDVQSRLSSRPPRSRPESATSRHGSRSDGCRSSRSSPQPTSRSRD